MPDTLTTNFGLTKPENFASTDTWGTKTNGNWDICDAQFAAMVRLTGAQTIVGVKTFSDVIVASAGVTINGNTLSGLSAVGKALAEAASVAAQRTLLALGTASTRDKAVTADLYAWTADKVLTADLMGSAFAPVPLAFAATVAWDWQAGYYFGPVVFTANGTIGLPTTIRAGESRMMDIQGNDATARTVSFATGFKGSLPSITNMTSTKKYRLIFTADTGGGVTVASEDRS